MGKLRKALAGVGQATAMIGLEELKNQSFMKRQERLDELVGKREDKAYERDVASSAAASEAALAKEQRGYKHAEKLKGMEIAGKTTAADKGKTKFIRPHDQKEFTQEELIKQFKVDVKLPDIDPTQFMFMDSDAQTRILEQIKSLPSFSEWTRQKHGIDVAGGYKPESTPAVGSGTMPWQQEEKPKSSYKSLWSE